MTTTWLSSIEEAFKERFNLPSLRAELSQGLPQQATLTLYLPVEPTAEMVSFARQLEAESAELDRVVWVRLRKQAV